MIGESQISKFYNSSEYTDIAMGLHVEYNFKEVESKFVHIYPHGKENIITFTRESQDTDLRLVDNENVSVTITGYEEHFVPGDTINVQIKNKSDQYIAVKVEEASANGIDMEVGYYGAYYVIVNPDAVAMYPMTLFDSRMDGGGYGKPKDTFFSTNGITSIEEIQMKLRIYPCNYVKAELGEDFVNETIILIPTN